MTIPPTKDPTRSQHWQALRSRFDEIKHRSLNSFFQDDIERAHRYCFEFDDLLVDLSKNHFDQLTLDYLLALADDMRLADNIEALFAGDTVNITESRPALHTALRSSRDPLFINDLDLRAVVDKELEKIQRLCEQIHHQQLLGFNDKPIDTIINIGIGGSDLGPRLVCDALKPYSHTGINCFFVANIDLSDLNHTLAQCDPDRTLIILASKSFTTAETLMNAMTAKQWLIEHGCQDLSKHFIAVTANQAAAIEFGIAEKNIFSFWSWVGGRYSLWSAIGLPIAIKLGMKHFRELLSGAEQLDQHFKQTTFAENIPVLLGLLDVWYSNFFRAESLAIVPYDHNLRLLPDYLSQLIMESNGKNIDRSSNNIDYQTSAIIWGSEGTNGQHAFFQLLHQGTHTVPIDFLIAINNHHSDIQHQQALVANCLAQSEALMKGQLATDEPHRHCPGNKPSTTIMFDSLTPKMLGKLLALYEHRTFVQACIYNINAFDQWGVELGKKLSSNIIEEFQNRKPGNHDASTQKLIQHFIDKLK